MLKDDFDRIMEIFMQSAEGKAVNLEQLFAQSMSFFEQLKEVLRKGEAGEKKEAMLLMGELYTKMMAEMKRISARTGLSEEQLFALSENPSNFSQDQWRVIQTAREKLGHTGTDLARIISGGAVTSLPPPPTPKVPSKKKGSSKKRGGWIQS
jgi:hypothetical protein